MKILMQKPDDPLTPTPGGSGEPSPPEGTPDPKTPDSDPPPTPTDSQSPFTSEAFKGKTEEELVQLFGVYEATVNEQGKELTRLHNESSRPPNTPTVPEVPVNVSAEEFWRNPSESVRAIVTDTVQGQLNDIIQPFKDDLADSRAGEAWRDARAMHSDLDQFKPMIDTLLSRAGRANPTLNEIEQYYYMAVGFSAREKGVRSDTPATPAPPNAPPQHPPSSHPIAPAQPKAPEQRELTENERTLARHSGLSEEEYLNLQGMDERDLLTKKEEPSNA